MQRLPARQALKIVDESIYLIIHGGILFVPADSIFPLSPQGIHGVQFGAPLRQPQQIDLIRPGQRRGISGRVARILVQQQGNVPAPVAVMNQVQERFKVCRAAVLAGQEQAVAGTQIHGSEDHPPGVPATQTHCRGLSAQRPTRTQRREQQQVGLVFSQEDAAWPPCPDLADLPTNPPFFSPPRSRDPERSDTVSKRSPAGLIRGGGCPPTACGPCDAPLLLATAERSSSPRSSRVGPAPARRGSATTRASPPSIGWVARTGSRRAKHWDRGLGHRPRSSCTHSGASPPASEQSGQWTALDWLRGSRASADTRVRLACPSIGAG